MPHALYPQGLAELCKADAGKQWEPSNGTEGYAFIESWCGQCQRDKSMREGVDFDECDDNECCPIIAASFRGEAKEWQYDKNGQPCCTAFVPAGDTVPLPKDNLTIDMFGEAVSK